MGYINLALNIYIYIFQVTQKHSFGIYNISSLFILVSQLNICLFIKLLTSTSPVLILLAACYKVGNSTAILYFNKLYSKVLRPQVSKYFFLLCSCFSQAITPEVSRPADIQ